MRKIHLSRATVKALLPRFAQKVISREVTLALNEAGEVMVEPGKIADLKAELSEQFTDRASFSLDFEHDDKETARAFLFRACFGEWPEGYEDAEELRSLQHANIIRGIEIFATGTHNGDEYTEKDLDDMVSAYKALDFKPALKVGHVKDKVGSPAYGYVENLRREGQKLLADFSSMHDSVVEAIRKRSYDRLSSEIYFNFKRGKDVFRRALKAVALLGSEVPAVAGLVPLHKVQFSAESGFEKESAFDVSLSVSTDSIVATLSERVAALTTLMKDHDMKTAAQVKKELAELNRKIAELKGKSGNEAELKTLAEKVEALTEEVKTLETAEDSAAENKELKARLAKLETEQKARDEKDRKREAKEHAAKLTVPAFVPTLTALFEHALAHPDEKVKIFSKKDGKDVEEEKTLTEVGDALVDEINAQAKRLFKAFDDKGGRRTLPDAPANSGANPADEMDRLANEYLVKHPELKGDYAAALEQVGKENPELAKQYEESQNPRPN